MKRFQLTFAAALLASASAFAADQFAGSFACKAKYSGKNTYLMDSCYVDYTFKKVVGAPSYSAKVSWTRYPGYTVGGVSVNDNDVANYKNYKQRYFDIAPTKATFNFTVLFYSEQFNCYIGSAQSSMVVDNLEKAGANYGPQMLQISKWDSLFSNVVIGKQDKNKIGTVITDAAFQKWADDNRVTVGKLDMSARGSRRSINRVFTNATRVEIVNPTVNLDWDIQEYVFINNAMKLVENISDAIANADTAEAVKQYFNNNPSIPPVGTNWDIFWRTTVAPYSLVDDAYKAAEDAYKKGDYNTAALQYQKVVELDPTLSYCSRRIDKINAYNQAKATRNVGGIEMALVEGANGIKNFYISKTEITQSQWRRVMGSTPGMTFTPENRNKPVTNVTWEEALEFVKKLNEQTEQNYRLVKTNEWEFAAKGGKNGTNTNFAGSNNISDVAWAVYNSEEAVHDVKTKQPNELGIYDMTGNVAEWTADVYDKKTRITKGGSYLDDASNCAISAKQMLDVKYKSKSVGFRIAQDE